jgi:hypothetical protein
MRNVSLSLAAVCSAVALAVAAPPAAPPKVSVTVGELARVEITPDAAGPVGWASGAADADLFADELAPRAGKTRLLIQAKRAGTYRVVLWSKGETDSTFVEVVATGGGADPVKPDPIKPDPVKPDPVKPDPVKPQPTAGKVCVVVVEESSLRTPAQADVMADPAFRKWLADGGHKWAVVDKDDPQSGAAGYAPYVAATGLPTVIMIDATAATASKPLSVFKLPATAAEFQAKVKEVVK